MKPEVGRAVPCPPGRWNVWISPLDGAQEVTRPAVFAARYLWLLLVAIALAGCQSTSFSTYVSPRVTGRVLAADTRQPVADVKVRRVNPATQVNNDEPTKGGRRLDSVGGAWTDPHGRFVLAAERDLTLLQQQVWFSVTVSFQHEGYLTLQTNFTSANVISNAPDGAPVVNAGDILLHPLSP